VIRLKGKTEEWIGPYPDTNDYR